jgi:hypothetical protein
MMRQLQVVPISVAYSFLCIEIRCICTKTGHVQ